MDNNTDDTMVLSWLDDIKCARALIHFKLGEVLQLSVMSEHEISAALDSLQKTLELFESVSNEGIKLKFLNVLQQTYNMFGQIITTHQADSNL